MEALLAETSLTTGLYLKTWEWWTKPHRYLEEMEDSASGKALSAPTTMC